jgi:hypothetical protein
MSWAVGIVFAALCVFSFAACFSVTPWQYDLFGQYGTKAKIFYAVCILISQRFLWVRSGMLSRYYSKGEHPYEAS